MSEDITSILLVGAKCDNVDSTTAEFYVTFDECLTSALDQGYDLLSIRLKDNGEYICLGGFTGSCSMQMGVNVNWEMYHIERVECKTKQKIVFPFIFVK